VTERLHLACGRQRVQRPLYRALTRTERKGQCRARPRFAVGEEGEHAGVFFLDGACDHDDVARGARHQREPVLRRAHVGQRSQQRAQPSDLDTQARAMGVIRKLRPKGLRNQHAARHVARPGFSERAHKREQHWTRGERDPRVRVAHDMTARIDGESLRCQQRLDVRER
jgi:hypothetical protein